MEKKSPDTLIIDGTHEPLINLETWQKVQEKINSAPKTKYMREGSAKIPFMLQGLVRCSACGVTLCQSQPGVSLQCYAYAHGKYKVSHHIKIQKINDLVLLALEKSCLTGNFKIEIIPKVQVKT